jgi:DNA-binding XRE family transcriptional regulator
MIKLTARQAATVRRMYEARDADGKRQYTVAETVGVHRTTVCGYLTCEKESDRVPLPGLCTALCFTFGLWPG